MNTELITIFEDYPNILPSYKDHIQNFFYLREIVKKNHFSLQADGTITIKHYVGFFQKGNTRVQILPKVYSKSGLGIPAKAEIKASLDFVYRLLYWSGYLNVKKLPSQSIYSSDYDLLEIFIRIFIDEFNNLFQRNIYRNYESLEENQQFIKGKILFTETVRRNPFLHHLHYIRFDEFSINNPLNRIFKALIVLLLDKTDNSDNKKKLVIGLTYLQDVDSIKLNDDIWQRIKFDRLNNDFKSLFNFAKLFYHNQNPGITEGDEKTFSFLVPLHLLFENFVAKVLAGFSNNNIEFRYHSPQRFYGYNGTEKIFLLQPDFVIMDGKKCLGILDTKYKYPYKKGKPAIDSKDLYQLSTYALRYKCRNLVLIYPEFVGAPNPNCCIADYNLKGAFGQISLKIIQIDIMEKDYNKIVDSIKYQIMPIINNSNIPSSISI